ncbi:MAG: hypothetical protein CVU38_18075 [Chloroflexi bacterium HGW-Chloroflexi-1]|nr:MAG: hypothetical protein CVU38_18075 [Chloroflexi bacterium HGW-Chloroflexi-1]
MVHPLRNRYLLVSDLFLLVVAAYVSYVLRLEKFDLSVHWPGFLLFTALALVITPLVFRRAGVYSRYWRYASVEEMLLLIGAGVFSCASRRVPARARPPTAGSTTIPLSLC